MSDPLPIDFYFEFSSPYGYIASQLAEEVEKRVGRPMKWRPFLLGPVFKITGAPPLVDIPMKGPYSKVDFSRTARYHGIPYQHPEKFPVGSVAAVRAFYWLDDRDAALARRFAKVVYKAYFADGRDIGAAATVLEVAREAGADTTALALALEDPALKERARREVEGAIERGVFGSPFFIVDGEPFWGCDRLPMLEEWVRRGGW